MRQAVEEMVESPALWQWMKQYSGGAQIDFDEDTSRLVESVRLRAAFERDGKQNHGLHVHILIEVAHTTMVQISKFGICELFRRVTGLNPNVHCRFVKGEGEDKDYILHYITKEVPSYKPQSQLNSRLGYAFRGDREEVEAENQYPRL